LKSLAPEAAEGSNAVRRLLALGLLLVVGLLLHLLGAILTPFLAGLALAYLWDPAVDRLERLGLGRTLAVSAVFLVTALLAAALVLVLVPLLGRQMHVVAAKVPVVVEWFRVSLLPWLQHRFDIGEPDIPLAEIKNALIANWQSAGGFAGRILSSATTSSLVLLAWFGNIVLIPVVSFYLLRDWDEMMARLRALLPRRWEPVVVMLAGECDEVVSAFIRGQLLVMLALGVCYTIGLMLVGLDLALLIGIASGLLSIVPYLGLVLGIVGGSIAALVQFGDWHPVLWVGLVFVLVQLFEGMYLTPKLVGNRIGLHPVVVIFAVMAGGQLFGFTGVLLALPAAAVIMVLARHVHELYRASSFYDAPAAPPPATHDAEAGAPAAGAATAASAPAGRD